VNTDDNIFISKSELNKIRRNVLENYERGYTGKFKRNIYAECLSEKIVINEKFETGYTAYVSSLSQLEAVLNYEFKRVYVNFDLIEDIISIDDKYKNIIVVVLPEIVKDSEKTLVDRCIKKAKESGVDKIMIHNYGQLCYSEEFSIVLSHRFNLWNSASAEFLKSYKPLSVFLSPELNIKTAEKISRYIQSEAIVYGNIPVMITENCIIKNSGSCPCDKDKFYYITDRYDKKFPVKSSKISCRSVLYNAVPIYLCDKLEQMKIMNGCIKNLFFTVENKKSCEKICSDYFSLTPDNMPKDFTRGHWFK